MKSPNRLLSLCGTVSLVSGVIAGGNGLDSRADEPCAQVASMVEPLRAANPSITPVIPGEVAYQCLQSVPLHSDEALAVTGSLLPYVQFQSDLSFKKAPPEGYPYPAVDLVGEITKVVDNLHNAVYASEYDWQSDLFRLFMSAKDGHFRFAGDLISRPVRFSRNVSLVSVSMDGVQVPQIYVLDDINQMTLLGNSSSFQPSAVAKINDQDATDFAQTEADRGFQQDKDAAYNTVFYNPALDFTPGGVVRGFFAGDGRYGFFYPGPNTTLTFTNGSTAVYETKARIPGNFTGVSDGESAFQRFCTNPQTTVTAAAPVPTFKPGDPLNNTMTAKGFPAPQVISSDLVAAGYYLKSQANSDVGVLSFNSFEPQTPAEFQAVIQTMLADMQRDGKTKLIVDLQGNGGGVIVNGFDAFRQLFPQTQDVMFARQRLHPGYLALANISSDDSANFSATGSNLDTLNIAENHYNFHFDLNQKREKFTSFSDKFGGVVLNNDNFTALQQWDWEDSLITSNETTGAGMDVTGYGARKNFTQPFAAENIVMLYDGICASTCTIFSELMRVQGKVKSIALGGNPKSQQIQAIGGTKGSQSLDFNSFFSLAQFFLQTEPNGTLTTALAGLSNLPQNRSLDDGVNFSDHILDANLDNGLPAQFVNEPADCRMFFTPAMVKSGGIEEMWEQAANVAWRGKSCVQGGISQGIVSARQATPDVRPQPKMASIALAARANLKEIQMRAMLMVAPPKMLGWDALHGKAIPNMHLA